MPSKSEKQRRFMGAELSRARKGQKTKTGMSAQKLAEFAKKPAAKRSYVRKNFKNMKQWARKSK